MTQRKMTTISTCIYLFCALIWAVNFAVNWCADGTITVSTGLFGLAAVCFAVAGIMGAIRVRHLPKEEK